MERSENQTNAVLISVKHGQAQDRELRFTDPFTIGRGRENDLQLKDTCVSRSHVKVFFDGASWQAVDMGSSNGTYVNGERITVITLTEQTDIELGRGGPVISVIIEKKEIPTHHDVPKKAEGPSSETQIIRHYFSDSSPETVGEHTMMFRRAFEKAHKKKSQKYWVIIGLSLLILMTSVGIIAYQKNKINKFKLTA